MITTHRLKKTTLKLILCSVCLATLSCGSGELTKSKVGDIIENRLEEKPFHKYFKIPAKFTVSFDMAHDEEFKYKENGIVNLIETGTRGTDGGRDTYYNLEISEKGKQYLATGYERNGKRDYMVIFWTHTLKEVQEVHINPSDNTAEVKVVFERSDITPFGKINMEEYGTKKTFEKKYNFKKTPDGWVWDYDYENYIKRE